MDEAVSRALERDRVIDITTTGRRSGRPQRVEIWFHNLDGRIYITGLPGRRSWYANVRANPELTFHLKQGAQADLAARARPITDAEERRDVLTRIVGRLGRPDLDDWLARSPLVEIELLPPDKRRRQDVAEPTGEVA
jgi:deazaflavin-dependent oxidoreductase (nitroreductase family)